MFTYHHRNISGTISESNQASPRSGRVQARASLDSHPPVRLGPRLRAFDPQEDDAHHHHHQEAVVGVDDVPSSFPLSPLSRLCAGAPSAPGESKTSHTFLATPQPSHRTQHHPSGSHTPHSRTSSVAARSRALSNKSRQQIPSSRHPPHHPSQPHRTHIRASSHGSATSSTNRLCPLSGRSTRRSRVQSKSRSGSAGSRGRVDTIAQREDQAGFTARNTASPARRTRKRTKESWGRKEEKV